MKIREALDRAARQLARAGVRSPSWDAERLLRHVLRWDRATLLARGGEPLPQDSADAFLALVEERARRRPLQHLVGSQPFWRHEFLVSPAAFIPRPETETLIEAALDLLRGRAGPVVVDVGTGTGCIALSLAAERADAEIHAVDLSAAAISLAEANARRLGLAGRVRFLVGDLLGPVARLRGRIDLIVSNPPYVDQSELPGLDPEVRDHEPRLALLPEGGRYQVYARLIPQAADALGGSGTLALEIGEGMAEEVARLCRGAGLGELRLLPDGRSITRVVLAGRPVDPSLVAVEASGLD